MSKRISITDIIVNTFAAVLAVTAIVLLCVYLVRSAPKDTPTAEVTEAHVIGTDPVSEPVTVTTASEVTTVSGTEEESVTETSVLHNGEYDAGLFGKAFFIGDSISVGLVGYEFIKPENAFAQQGITTSSVASVKIDEQTVYEKISAFGPEYICIMLGTNGLAFLENDVMANELGVFVDSLKERYPDAKTVIVSIPPVTQKREEEHPQKLDIVIEYNELLKQLAEEKDVAYADSCSLLQDETGYLGADYAERDGLHMKIHAYPVILGAIEDALMQHYGIDPSAYETAAADVPASAVSSAETAAQTSQTVRTEEIVEEETAVPDIIISDIPEEIYEEAAVDQE